MTNRLIVGTAALALCAGAATAQTGTNFIGGYGAPLFSQTVGTGFGNSNIGHPDFANGSEIDGLFGKVVGGVLRIGISGNLESNFNKLDLFFDVKPGGQNRLRGDNAGVDFNGLNRMGDDGSGNGLRFDTGFDADYWAGYTIGNASPEHYLNAAVLATGGGGPGTFVGGGPKPGLPVIFGVGPNGAPISITSNNSNVLGVNNFGAPFDSPPGSVDTGVELWVSLAELGWDGVSPIKVAGFVNGGSHDFLSNQLIGGLPPTQPNVGEPRSTDLNQYPGLQFVVVPVPGPSSLALVGLGGLLAARRRR
jgi:hypothetical protein